MASGRETFRRYMLAVTCGVGAPAYEEGMYRELGIGIIPGAILGCIEHGITQRGDILRAVARVTHCRDDTVAAVLDGFDRTDHAARLWSLTGERYYVGPAAQTALATKSAPLLAA